MKKLLLVVGALLLALAAGLPLLAARHIERVSPGTSLGPIPVGGLSRAEAAQALREWWRSREQSKLKPVVEGKELTPMTPAQLGLELDEEATLAQLPLDDFWRDLSRRIIPDNGGERRLEVAFRSTRADTRQILAQVAKTVGEPRSARAFWRNGRVQLEPEVTAFDVDFDGLRDGVRSAIASGADTVAVPLLEEPKRVPDEELQKIKDVVAEFSTRFPASNRPRSANIKLASSKFDGLVLMPGDRVGYNDTVGKRTLENGFQVAGVYRLGRHDFDVGGGICQVSTTLYNAALLGNLKIVKRMNHSMPVPYVPVGRDATVDYGFIDLVLENSHDSPVAIATEYKPGQLTFRILGAMDASLEVKVIGEGHRSWPTGEKTITDPALPPGKRKIVEKGSRGHEIKTYRLLFKDGVLLAREPLGRSFYKGADRIIAVGERKEEPKVPAPAPSPSPSEPPAEGPPAGQPEPPGEFSPPPSQSDPGQPPPR